MKKNLLFSLLFILGFTCCAPQNVKFETDVFALEINSEGKIQGLTDKKSGTNYFAQGQESYLLQLRVDTTFYQPQQFEWIEKDKSFKLVYPDCKASVNVNIKQDSKYLSFEIADFQSESPVDVAVWGPYATSIKQTIGECVGLVRDSAFAIGIQALNAKTLGGYPSDESDVEPQFDIFATTSLVDISDDVKVLYRGQTATHKDFGSVLQAYCRDRSK